MVEATVTAKAKGDCACVRQAHGNAAGGAMLGAILVGRPTGSMATQISQVGHARTRGWGPPCRPTPWSSQ